MNASERYFKITELLTKFKNGEELYKKSSLFHQSLQLMAEGMSVYEVLEQVILSCERMQNAFEDYMNMDTRPFIITPNL